MVAVCFDRTLMFRRISQRVGIPVRKLQNWRGLAIALGYAVVSAAIIRIAVNLSLEGGPGARLALGACGLALAYAPILLRWRAR